MFPPLLCVCTATYDGSAVLVAPFLPSPTTGGMRLSALLLTLLALTASQGDNKVGWEQDTTGGKGCWRNANTGESYGCDTSAGDKAPGSGQDSDKTWDKTAQPPTDKTAQPPTMPPRPSLPPGASSRPKILCLHGGGGNDEGFRMQANSLIQAAPGLEFVFVSAPNSGGLWIPDPPSSGGAKGTSTDANWDSDSVALVDGVIREQGPFYGILGYSQGAAYAISYLSHAPAGTFQLAALFCGYLPSTHLGIMARINDRMRPGGTRRLVCPVRVASRPRGCPHCSVATGCACGQAKYEGAPRTPIVLIHTPDRLLRSQPRRAADDSRLRLHWRARSNHRAHNVA